MPDKGASNRYQFLVTEGAKEDLLACRDDDPRAAAFIAAYLREIAGDLRAQEALVDDGYEDETVHSVKLIGFLQQKRVNAYRVRLIGFDRWRLVTAVDHRDKRIGLFGVMWRNDDYDPTSEYWKAIEAEYDELGFTRY